jgi:predicted glycoside hydrolase/deacetylase ChbG (UPF0249 family)
MIHELSEQVRRLADLGAYPEHFDSHQNKHLYPMFFFAVMEVAGRWRIRKMRSYNRYLFMQNKGRRVRFMQYYSANPRHAVTHSCSRLVTWYAHVRGVRTPDRLISPLQSGLGGKHIRSTWLDIADSLPVGVNEIYVHPGYVDELLWQHSSYVREREDEVRVLIDSDVRSALVNNGVELISFRDV